jgi:hypothetical protein
MLLRLLFLLRLLWLQLLQLWLRLWLRLGLALQGVLLLGSAGLRRLHGLFGDPGLQHGDQWADQVPSLLLKDLNLPADVQVEAVEGAELRGGQSKVPADKRGQDGRGWLSVVAPATPAAPLPLGLLLRCFRLWLAWSLLLLLLAHVRTPMMRLLLWSRAPRASWAARGILGCRDTL